MPYTFKALSRVLFLLITISILNACGSSGSGSDKDSEEEITLTGSVLSYQNDDPIANASVNIRYGNQRLTASTNSEGQFSVAAFSTDQRITLNADAEGYAEHAVILTSNRPLADQLTIRLQENSLNLEFDSTLSQNFALDDLVLLNLPENALVDSNGTLFEGTAKVEINVIDPALDSSTMPGDYQVQPENGNSDILESFGALAVTFQSPAGPLNLAAGQQATIRIPVSSLYDISAAPSTMPLYYFDNDSGFWVEEGSATLVEDAETGQPVYVGQVSHFTVWNADQPLNTVELTGCVFDSTGNPLANIQIISDGRDYIGRSSAYTGNNGCYTIQVRINSDLILYFSGNGESYVLEWNSSTLSVPDVTLEASAFSAKLTWGANPYDLDAHFITPAGEVYFSNSSLQQDGFFAMLDVDDTSSFGPEVISSSAFNIPGCYEYYVHNYSGTTAWDLSNAKVNISLDNQHKQFLITQADAQSSDFQDVDKRWSIFTADVDADLNVTINWRNTLVDNTHCESEGGDFEEFALSDEFSASGLANRHLIKKSKSRLQRRFLRN